MLKGQPHLINVSIVVNGHVTVNRDLYCYEIVVRSSPAPALATALSQTYVTGIIMNFFKIMQRMLYVSIKY